MEENSKTKKSRNDTDIKKVQGVDPNFLSKYADADSGLDALKEHRVVPRIKLIQPTSDMKLKTDFGEGTAIVRPGDTMVCKYETDPSFFHFVPLFFFVEWAKWADLKDKSGPMILDRSFDPTSVVAKKAKNYDTMFEVYKGQEEKADKDKWNYRNVEHLRFIGVLYGDHPLVGIPITLSFERGEWKQGKNFISAIMLQRQMIDDESTQVKLWAQVWELRPQFRDRGDKRWYGFDFAPADPSIIQPDEADTMLTMHKEFAELFEQQRLTVQDEPTESVAPDPAAVKANQDF